MSTSTPRSPAEQKAWTEGFNTGVAMAIKSLRQTMLPDGPTLDDIDRALGLPSPALPAARSDGQTIGEFYGDPGARCSIETDRLDWQTASEKDCCDALYQIGGALRRGGNFDLAQDAERIADALYPGKIKPAPIVPRTTT